MDKLRKGWHCAMYTFMANNLRPITLAALFLMFALLGDKFLPIREYMAGETINIWGLYASMLNNSECVLVIGIALLLIMGNAPFVTEAQQSILIRAGQKNWLLGQMIYMAATTLAIMMGMLVYMCLFFAPHISFDNNWGRVLNSLATLDTESTAKVGISVYALVVDSFSPIQAFMIGFGLRWICYLICINLMFFINLLVKQRPGAVFALAILLLDFIAEYVFNYADRIYSVSTLCKLNSIAMAPNPYCPDVQPMMLVILGWFVAVSAGCIIAGRRADIGKMAM